jgi:hypothetical protein
MMAGKWVIEDEPAGQWVIEDDAPAKRSKRDLVNSAISESIAPAMNYSGKDAVGGAARGAGSIGATLIRPFEGAEANKQRRTAMDGGLRELGADPDSMAFKTNKLLAEIGGTAGAGGAIANVAGRVLPAAVTSAPFIQSLLNSVKTGGFALGKPAAATMGGKAVDLVARAGGGAVTGGTMAGLVDPESASTGAMIGGVMPVAVQGVGRAAEAYGKLNKQKAEAAMLDFARNAPRNQTVKEAVEAGYVIPPNMVKPTFKNQVVESISGKQATQQIFSEKNEKVTGTLVRKALGLPDDAPLSAQALENLRKTAGRSYADVSNISKQAADDVYALRVARNEANGWFQAYNRSARPDDLEKAKAARALSAKLEEALEQHAAKAGKPELIPSLREARKQIAKTYTVGRALNDASGTVDARVLGKMHEKGLPLSDGLDVAGKFASAFPTVAKSSQQVGSPAAHNMKAIASSGLGLGGAATMGFPGAALAAVPFVMPPAARVAMLRKGVQKGLVQTAPKAASNSALAELLMDQDIQRLLLRSAPVAGSN